MNQIYQWIHDAIPGTASTQSVFDNLADKLQQPKE